MIHLKPEDGYAQGSAGWVMARIGIPTASRFDRILTPKTRKKSAQSADYMHELLAEWALGCSLSADAACSAFMDRGTVQEASAVEWYEFQRDVECQPCGFFLRDDRSAGASPDRLVGGAGLLEIKCPAAKTFIAYLLGVRAGEHISQVQGQMWITGRAWCDLLIYHPELPSQIVRIPRDEEYIAELAAAVGEFCMDLAAAKIELRKMGVGPIEVAAQANARPSGASRVAREAGKE